MLLFGLRVINRDILFEGDLFGVLFDLFGMLLLVLVLMVYIFALLMASSLRLLSGCCLGGC